VKYLTGDEFRSYKRTSYYFFEEMVGFPADAAVYVLFTAPDLLGA
jgi:hypothetical protein